MLDSVGFGTCHIPSTYTTRVVTIVQTHSEITEIKSPSALMLSWQHGCIRKTTYKHSRLGQTVLVFGLYQSSSVGLCMQDYKSLRFVPPRLTHTGDSVVQPQMDQDHFRNISNLDLVEPNQIRDSIYACIRLLFANFTVFEINKNNRANATHGPSLVQKLF